MMDPAAVFCLSHSGTGRSAALAADFGLPLVRAHGIGEKSSKERLRFFQGQVPRLPCLVFLVDAAALQLALVDGGGILAIGASFHGAGVDYRREKGGGRSERIAKAVGLKGSSFPTVIDATAGLGVDAFVLASLGCRVTMLERVPAVNALLRDGLERSHLYAAANDPGLEAILGRLQSIPADATAYLQQLPKEESPDVIYLDPMFPERKKSAAVKKEMQVFHKLIGPDEDANRLFETALARARNRVVVKRPRIAPSLSGREPGHTVEGKRSRYDVYPAAANKI